LPQLATRYSGSGAIKAAVMRQEEVAGADVQRGYHLRLA
jgi:hypothetical protein